MPYRGSAPATPPIVEGGSARRWTQFLWKRCAPEGSNPDFSLDAPRPSWDGAELALSTWLGWYRCARCLGRSDHREGLAAVVSGQQLGPIHTFQTWQPRPIFNKISSVQSVTQLTSIVTSNRPAISRKPTKHRLPG